MTKLVSQREVFRGKITRLTVDTVDLPNGHRADLEILHHPGGAAIVALDDQDRVCLLHQFRHAAGGYVWELPAGKLELGESPELTAQRELIEEAGVNASTWRSLGVSLSSPGVFTERIHLYLATDLTPAPDAREAAEVFEVHWIALETAVKRVLSGEIDDSKTGLGLLRAWHVRGEKP
ncbi:MAG: NUDIX domain-containing protein [Steroidobacteraceae bacterium]